MTRQPTDRQPPRKPTAFAISEDTSPKADINKSHTRQPASFELPVRMIEDKDDPFLGDRLPDDLDAEIATERPRRFSWGGLALSAFGLILALATGLWIDQLITDLSSRADWLGYVAMATTALLVLAMLVVASREILALRRLAAARSLRLDVENARRDPRPALARQVVERLAQLTRLRPETARGRAALEKTEGEIIDGAGLMALAETELLTPLDDRARTLVLSAAKRVSIVTAVSPRALVDLFYVLFEASRLVRAIAETYDTRPGSLGFIRLFRDVLAHLAVTGSIAMGDSLVQQFIGHGLASKLSARLGEGVINGLMTARIGIAAMDLCRPMPFSAVKRPGIGDFIGDITGTIRS